MEIKAAKEITDTLSFVDNEGTESPYWLIVDPSSVTGRLKGIDEETEKEWKSDLEDEDLERIGESIPNCITGPFFSRKDAEDHLNARRYAFSSKAYVYCFSGYWSQKYKALCREIGVGHYERKT